MGMGDVKLAPFLGAHLAYAGWTALARGLLFGFFAQAAIVVVLMASRRVGRRSHVAHGPAMCIGAIVSLVSVF
jgi:leader peptidase (prepilin peptidase)/N-methyltransferase